MARKKASKEEPTAPWKPNYDKLISEVSQSVGMTPVSLKRQDFVDIAVSTGLLAYDLCVGGGFAPGRFCGQYGPEAGGKSTACASSIAQAQKKEIDSFFFDHEGSADPAYWSRIGVKLYGDFKAKEAQEVAATEKGFTAGPHLRYFVPEYAEDSLKFMSRLLHLYPDKRQYDDQWYYVYKKPKLRECPMTQSSLRKLETSGFLLRMAARRASSTLIPSLLCDRQLLEERRRTRRTRVRRNGRMIVAPRLFLLVSWQRNCQA